MSIDVVLDTNILVYAVDTDPGVEKKRRRARDLIREDRFGTSALIVQEFYVTVTRMLATPLPPVVAARWVDRLCRCAFVPIDAPLLKSAIIRSQAWRIPYWDATVISAAEALGATRLYSENLNHGQVYGRVQVFNPFNGSGP